MKYHKRRLGGRLEEYKELTECAYFMLVSPCEHASHRQIYQLYQHIQSIHGSIQFQHPNSLQHNVPFHLQDVDEIVTDLCQYQAE